jgi:large subunit ribosomal protein L4
MQLDILNSGGTKTGRTIELPEEIFGIEPNDHVIYLAVKQYRAAQRQGTHSTKTRAEVQGSSKKLHRQKGTGGSRKGNIRNPLYKGGGTINGPKPHSYDFKLNRKVKDLAKMSALAHKAQEGKIVIVEDLSMEAPKTSQFATMLTALKGDARRTLFVLPEHDANVYLSGRNLKNNRTVVLSDLNTYDLVNASLLVFTESTAQMFLEEAPADDNAAETPAAEA